MSQLWKYPKFNVPSNLLEVTDEMLSEWEKENKECDEFNKSILKTLIEMKESVIASSKNIWGNDSNVVKYLHKQSINKPYLSQLDYIKPRVLKVREDENEKIYNIERQQKYFEICGKAIKFLTDRNKIINIDFNIDNAICIANKIAYEEAIYNKKKELSESGIFIDFNGHNCEDRPCRGWDGSSHRCECGNRRVSWESNDNKYFF